MAIATKLPGLLGIPKAEGRVESKDLGDLATSKAISFNEPKNSKMPRPSLERSNDFHRSTLRKISTQDSFLMSC